MANISETFQETNPSIKSVKQREQTPHKTVLKLIQDIFDSEHDFSKPKVVTITPDIAQKLLKLNTRNRAHRPTHIAWLTAQMKLGLWIFCGKFIPITISGILGDSQHFLYAICKSGTPCDAILMTGLSDDIINVIDTGKARTAADILQINGFLNANEQAAIAKKVHAFFHRDYSRTGERSFTKIHNKSDEKSIITNTIILQRVAVNNLYLEAAKFALAHNPVYKDLFPSFVGAFYFIFSYENKAKAKAFMYDLVTLDNVSKDAPQYILHQHFKKIKKERDKKGIKHSSTAYCWWMVKSWRAYIDGKKIVSLPDWNRSYKIPEIYFKKNPLEGASI